MRILPTLEGGLCILPESEKDWQELQLICSDDQRPALIAESLADLMDEECEWAEYVTPDLERGFQDQTQMVAEVILKARGSDQQAVFIAPNEAEKWYGAINQARLSLQAGYQLDELDDLDELNAPDQLDDLEPDLKSAYYRNRFYLLLQSMLLEYIMES